MQNIATQSSRTGGAHGVWVGPGFGVEFCTCSGPSRCLPTVCIPSCCIFSPDQGRATATISSRFGRMELSCHHQRTLSPCFNVATSSTGTWEDTGRPPSWNLRHSSHCKAQLCDDMQFCCLVTRAPSKARCQSRCASSVPTAVSITRSHASREQRLQQLRSLSASTAAEKYVHRAVEVYRYHQDLQPNVLANDLTVEWRWHAAQSKRSVKGFSGL